MRLRLPDTVIVNTCAVTAEAERQARQAIRRAVRERPGARIVVTGCAAQIDPQAWRDLPGVDRVLGNEEKLPAGKLGAGCAGGGLRHHGGARDGGASGDQFAGRARAFVQVQQGCDHRCTFCMIPSAVAHPQRAGRRRGGQVRALVRKATARWC